MDGCLGCFFYILELVPPPPKHGQEPDIGPRTLCPTAPPPPPPPAPTYKGHHATNTGNNG